MIIGEKGKNLIKRFEGLSLTVYLDEGGLATVGYGHRTDLPVGAAITLEEANNLLAQDLIKFEQGVTPLVQVPINQNQFDALCSFAYNVGLGALEHSHLLKKLNAGDVAGCADEFLRWDQVSGKVASGLLKRREAERALFLS
jgi:lysozyme